MRVPRGSTDTGGVVGYTREELEGYRDGEVPDLVGEDPRLVFVGINPGLWTVATQTHFAHPSNRFYVALHRAGVIQRQFDAAAGMDDDDRDHLVGRGIAITNIAARATGRASELSGEELREGAEALVARVEQWQPRVVAVAGVTAYRTAFRRPRAVLGRQDEGLAGADLWVVPNPSGLNAHETVDSLSAWYGQAAWAAGILDVAPGADNSSPTG